MVLSEVKGVDPSSFRAVAVVQMTICCSLAWHSHRIFADGSYGGVSGLIAGQADQLVSQLISTGAVAAWAFGAGLALFWLIRQTVGLRPTRAEELEGLDKPEHGVLASPEHPPHVVAAPLGAGTTNVATSGLASGC